MKYLSNPPYDARATFEACVSSIDAGDLKSRLAAVVDIIEAAEKDYLQHGPQSTLFSISTAAAVGAVTGDEMKRVYKGTFVRSVKTRHIYHALKKRPANDLCPLCSQRTVTTLDHYLAQKHHPGLVVTPANLVPACGECNKLKRDMQPATAADQTLHPYFDNLDEVRWLYADVQETVPARLLFRVSPPTEWPELKKQRAAKHFSTFGLGTLYSSHAAVELTNIRHYLTGIAQADKPKAVGDFLAALAESAAKVHLNSWQTATYTAFSQSDWFCRGGFAQV